MEEKLTQMETPKMFTSADPKTPTRPLHIVMLIGKTAYGVMEDIQS